MDKKLSIKVFCHLDKLLSKKIFILMFYFLFSQSALANNSVQSLANNFGLPGYLELPIGKSLPNGEIVVTQQLHRSLARTGISFQLLPKLSFSFRYSSQGPKSPNHRFATGRYNHDRSFDAHLNLFAEGQYMPSISIGLRDFIGTGWYSSEYLVGTKTVGKLEISAGLGFGRLAGQHTQKNPLGYISKRFDKRDSELTIFGGTLGAINWFEGQTSPFIVLAYRLGEKITISGEYNPDLMGPEKRYMDISSPLNFGLDYKINDYIHLSSQYLYGTTFSLKTNIHENPKRPPFRAGMELAPVPMRKRQNNRIAVKKTDEAIIRKILSVDEFEIIDLSQNKNTIRIDVINRKFRSVSQAVGRISSTLQRFSSDKILFAEIVFHEKNMQLARYFVEFKKIGNAQFSFEQFNNSDPSIKPSATKNDFTYKNSQKFSWGLGPYVTHRLFNPDLPLSAEAGGQLTLGYNLFPRFRFETSLRKSVIGNLTKNARRSNSELPRVHSDWPLYDLAGQKGHINDFKFSYLSNIAPNIFGRTQIGFLEPFFAGVGGEILYKQPGSPFALGLDIHHVIKREYNMLFDLRNYKTTLGHFSFYYDAGGIFDLEINAGRYLARDWGATTKISRKFGNGWEVGGYATFTDVPFHRFGEGSFDKAIYVSAPMDWFIGKPSKSKRQLVLRPITRDGGAQLASARTLNKHLERYQNAQFLREIGRLWK